MQNILKQGNKLNIYSLTPCTLYKLSVAAHLNLSNAGAHLDNIYTHCLNHTLSLLVLDVYTIVFECMVTDTHIHALHQ